MWISISGELRGSDRSGVVDEMMTEHNVQELRRMRVRTHLNFRVAYVVLAPFRIDS